MGSSRIAAGGPPRPVAPGGLPAVPRSRHAGAWTALILLLVALRLPSLVQPAGGDQGLYGYSAQRLLAGDVLYRDAWDQKPPGIAAVYGVLETVWPGESVVPGADLAVAALIACLLVVLGRRRFSAAVGYAAAVLFLLFGDPYLQRLGGIYVRAQTEPFIALAITAGLVLLAAPHRGRRHLFGAGLALAAAFWLKYNAAAYALVLAAAVWAWDEGTRTHARRLAADLAWMAAGFAAVGLLVIGYFAANHALLELRLATLDYNLSYSNETYEGPAAVLRYLVTFPVTRARIDMIWFLGGLGALLLLPRLRSSPTSPVVYAWLFAAILSIAINGSRSLPNYFVQANPALALAAATGLATLARHGRMVRYAVAVLLLSATWRVGADTPVWGLRLGSLPGLIGNVRYDLQYVLGRVDRDQYLARFKGQKHDALDIDRLARDLRATTAATAPVFVFGFSGGSVGWKSGRVSPSRFFWSRPIIIEFAEDRPGYGSAGLLRDLERRPAAVVALQKDEWGSREFFFAHDGLRHWLESEYVFDRETPMFSVWKRRHDAGTVSR